MWDGLQWEFLPGTSLVHSFTTHILLRNYCLFLKPVKMKNLQPFKNTYISFIQISFILLCPKSRCIVEYLTDRQKRIIIHNFITALSTQATPQKPKGCTFVYTNVLNRWVHWRSLPCFLYKLQINYLSAKENTSTSYIALHILHFFLSGFGLFRFPLVPPSFSSLQLFLPLTTLFQTPFPRRSIYYLFFLLFFHTSLRLEKSFFDKSFSYCPTIPQDKGLPQARLHLLAPLS